VSGITARFPVLAGSKYVVGATFIAKLNPSATALLYTAAIPGTGGLPLIMPFGSNVPYPDVSMSMTVDSAGNPYSPRKAPQGFPVTANAIQTTGGIVQGSSIPPVKIWSTERISVDPATTVPGRSRLTRRTTPSYRHHCFRRLPRHRRRAAIHTWGRQCERLRRKGEFVGHGIDLLHLPGWEFVRSRKVHSCGFNRRCLCARNIEFSRFPVTGGAYQSDFNPGSSAFLAKLNSDATALVYATYVSSDSLAPGILAVDTEGNAYVSGQAGPGFGVSLDALQPCRAGAADAFVLQLAPDGKFAAATFLGGSGTDNAFALEAIETERFCWPGFRLLPIFW